MPLLTGEQIARFHRDGFVLGPQVLSDDEVETLRTETLRVIDERDRLEQRPVRISNLSGDEAHPVWQIVNIWQASEPFRNLMQRDEIAEAAAQLSGARELRIWHDQIQYKPAQIGGVNMWHQDAPYWPVLTPDDTQVTAWVALDDVDEENGCMSMVLGSHEWGDQISFLHTVSGFDALPGSFDGHPVRSVLCPVRRGQVHFHHSLTWHGSNANRSGRPRRAIALHYMTEATRYKASGEHLMKPYIESGDGEMVRGEVFQVVWPVG